MMDVEPNLLDFDPKKANLPMSRLSKWMKSHFDISKIIASRRHNYERLVEELSALDNVRVLFSEAGW